MIESRSEFLPIRGLRYHVRRWGDPKAPAVLLCHGWLDVSATWQPVVEPLLTKFQVLSPDWRGLGHSQWPQDGYWFPDYVADLAALAAHYQSLGPFRVVGHSMGGQVASLYAGLRPDSVSHLALLDSLFLPDMPADLARKRYSRWLDELQRPAKELRYDSFDDLAERIRHRHPELDAPRALFVAHCWGREDGHGHIRLCADPRHRLRGPGLYRVSESMDIWRAVTAPTLFIDAGKSTFAQAIGPEELQRRRSCFRDHRALVIAEGGHMLHFSAPQQTAAALLDFLDA